MTVFAVFFILFGHVNLIFGNNFSISMTREFGREYSAASHVNKASYGHSGAAYGGGGSVGGGGGSFFDIALTGLAFLSFGIFLLNLLLNALLGTGFITGTVVPTGTQTGGIITITESGTAGRGSRSKRSVLELDLDPVSSAEVMASVILQSIDAMVNEHECVKKVFCDGNKDAKTIGRGFQYLFPAYSFGASYISQKTGFHRNLTDHVDAIFHGIENSNCQQHFPQC